MIIAQEGRAGPWSKAIRAGIGAERRWVSDYGEPIHASIAAGRPGLHSCEHRWRPSSHQFMSRAAQRRSPGRRGATAACARLASRRLLRCSTSALRITTDRVALSSSAACLGAVTKSRCLDFYAERRRCHVLSPRVREVHGANDVRTAAVRQHSRTWWPPRGTAFFAGKDPVTSKDVRVCPSAETPGVRRRKVKVLTTSLLGSFGCTWLATSVVAGRGVGRNRAIIIRWRSLVSMPKVASSVLDRYQGAARRWVVALWS